ncbi:endonuclease domain-containing protein [Microvirga brassicacearum]|uniref:Endonuclease domain-containing protein n=1 Tax=Microvirga brassicacearum TaxID=2580413 RepID=A0A5N3P412_9HYPH|nr:endonuclease domain-containing protein [Microvirga brassicacearum]KAB0264478.1 endonuclease domain-containing protein [Microvirga brassicacearum]
MSRSRKPHTALSRVLRKRMTEAEKCLWWHLDRVPLADTHFRKQAPVGPYIADFVCHRAGLIIEVDGSPHGLDEGMRADAERTAWLNSQGYRILRFWNHEVLSQIDVVLDTIHAALYTPSETSANPQGSGADTPTPGPSPQGGGE